MPREKAIKNKLSLSNMMNLRFTERLCVFLVVFFLFFGDIKLLLSWRIIKKKQKAKKKKQQKHNQD